MKKQQKFFAFFLTAAMTLSLFLPVSAEGFKAESGNAAAAVLSYIPEADAVLIAENIVQNRIGRDDCPWTEETMIDETVQLFDFDGAVSGYLFRLATAGEAAGYVQVDAYAEAPQAVAFGYDCQAALDSMRQAQGKPEATSEDQIIALGVYDFIETDETGYKDAATGRVIDAPAAELSAAYKAKKAEQRDETQKARLITLKAQNSLYAVNETVQPQAQIVYEHVNVPNLWGATNFNPYIYTDFPGYDNHCTLVAAMNMLNYWSNRRGIANLYSKPTALATFKDLRALTDHSNLSGTVAKSVWSGMLTYLDKYNLTQEAGSDYLDRTLNTYNFGWGTVKNCIQGGVPFIVGTSGYPKAYPPYDTSSVYHTLFGIGYQECSDGDWVRVADSFDRSLSNFLSFTGATKNEYTFWYLRW